MSMKRSELGLQNDETPGMHVQDEYSDINDHNLEFICDYEAHSSLDSDELELQEGKTLPADVQQVAI